MYLLICILLEFEEKKKKKRVLILIFFCRVMLHHFCVACEIEQTYRGHLSIAIHVHHCPFRRHHY